MAQTDLQPRTALIVLTALNLLNYVDRNVLFAVQPLVQDEFHLTNAQIGYLTSAFLGFYMIAAPFVGPLADRYSRKLIIVLGALFWSGITLLTAFTHSYTELLVRHTLVGVGEATFVTIAPTFVADLFAEKIRGLKDKIAGDEVLVGAAVVTQQHHRHVDVADHRRSPEERAPNDHLGCRARPVAAR